jgi:hypothetical protein
MRAHVNRMRIPKLLLPVLLLLGLAFIAPTAGVVAEKVSTNQTVAQTVRNHQEQCGDLGGTFTTGGWTTPGDKPGTLVRTTFTKCEFNGDVTTCYHTPGSVDCRSSVTAPPVSRDEVTVEDEAMADTPFDPAPGVATAVDEPEDSTLGSPDPTSTPATRQPTIVPVADPRG